MKKIGIVTSARELNYGAILQAYATLTIIGEMGYEPTLLWWNNQKEKHHDVRIRKLVGMCMKYATHPKLFLKSVNSYKEAFSKEMSDHIIKRFHRFEKENLRISFLSYYQMHKFAQDKRCKAIIAGSDQIWNSYAIYVDPFYYLRFCPKNKRIAYAPSLGKSDIPYYNKDVMKRYIKDIPFLSIREKSGKNLIEELTERKVELVIDPSLLLTKNQWKSVERNIKLPTRYILLYFLDEPNESCIKHLEAITNKGKTSVIAFPYQFPKLTHIKNIRFVEPGPAEFLTLISQAELVLTDSFHGTAFSINYNKEFYTFNRQYGSNQSQSSRLEDFLDGLGLRERFIRSIDDSIVGGLKIDYHRINQLLDKKRKESMEYLLRSIQKAGE